MYAVIQKDFAVFGTGSTKEAAIEDASQYTDKEEITPSDVYSSANSGDFVVIEATQELVEKVQKEGGDIIFYVNNNVAGLEEN